MGLVHTVSLIPSTHYGLGFGGQADRSHHAGGSQDTNAFPELVVP